MHKSIFSRHVTTWLRDKPLSKIHPSTSLLGGSSLCAVSHSASCAREAEATQTHTHSRRNHRVITHSDQQLAIGTHCLSLFWHTQVNYSKGTTWSLKYVRPPTAHYIGHSANFSLWIFHPPMLVYIRNNFAKVNSVLLWTFAHHSCWLEYMAVISKNIYQHARCSSALDQ